MALAQYIPHPDIVLALEPEELAFTVLEIAKSNVQGGLVAFNCVRPNSYGVQGDEIFLAASEAWNWLEVHGFLLKAPGVNGENGYRVISRRGRGIRTKNDFESFRAASAFPKAMLHPSIADKVWLDLARGDLAVAVFISFRAVEEAVREAGGFEATDIGVNLMRKAFNANNGPLSDKIHPEAEREALANLFVGAIGSYKNPHSHRTVNITEIRDAQEMVLLASHLLRIVDSRRP